MDCRRCNCGMLDEDTHVHSIGFGFPTVICLSCFCVWLEEVKEADKLDDVIQAEIDFLFRLRNRNDLIRIKELVKAQCDLRHTTNMRAMLWIEKGTRD